MKKIIIFGLMIVACFGRIGLADEYAFPEIKPELYLWGGYRNVQLDGSARAEEYEYVDDSFAFGGEFYAFPFPHRIHVEGEVLNGNDYFGDVRYAYKDLVLFRWITRKLYHNLDNITLRDFDSAAATPSIDIRDAGDTYGVKTGLDKYFLRLKTPDFPLHLYTEARIFHRKGTLQQRFLGGSGYYNDAAGNVDSPERATIDRDIHWETEDYTIGTNNHLGPVELDIAHTAMRFTPKGDEALVEPYDAAGFPPGSLRAAGSYEHNRIPELKGYTNTLKAHTSYTGRIVASGTLSNTNRENNYSGAEADTLVGHGELVWMPAANLTFFTKYRYQATDVDNPDSITIVDKLNPATSYTYTNIRPSIDSHVNRITGAMRYKPLRNITLKAECTRERREREKSDAEAWHLPNSTTRDIYALSLYSRFMKKVKLSAKYVYQKTNQGNDDSVIHYEPEHSGQGVLSLSWTPLSWMTAFLNYNFTKDRTSHLQLLDYYGSVVGQATDRARSRERLFGSITFQLTEKLSLSPSYTYLYNEVEQDLIYDAYTSGNLVDDGVKDKSKVHNCAVNVMYIPANNLSINAMVNYTKSSGEFHPGISEALNPGSIALFSEVRKEEIVCELEGTYNFTNGWDVGLRYRYTDYDDESFDNPESGDCSATMMMISKKW